MRPSLGGLFGAALTGAIIGAVTGAVLLWMLRENRALLDGLHKDLEAGPSMSQAELLANIRSGRLNSKAPWRIQR